jgi:DNA-binding GntR family transcriptional regulator
MKGQAADPFNGTASLQILTKAEAVYLALRGQILDRTLEPGLTLNQEVLATRLGVSVTPLREALRRLEGEGLVNLTAHGTLSITPVSRQELDDLYATRLLLDPTAASLAAIHASHADIVVIAELAIQAEIQPAPLAYLRANRLFHRAVYSACGNSVLADVLDDLWTRTDRYRLVAVLGQLPGYVQQREHRAIAAALEERNSEKVAQLMYDHVDSTYRSIQEYADDL